MRHTFIAIALILAVVCILLLALPAASHGDSCLRRFTGTRWPTYWHSRFIIENGVAQFYGGVWKGTATADVCGHTHARLNGVSRLFYPVEGTEPMQFILAGTVRWR